MTANVILEKKDPLNSGTSTFSVYYGQSFESANSDSGLSAPSRRRLNEDRHRGAATTAPKIGERQSSTLLYDRLTAKTATELAPLLPRRLDPGYIVDRFQSSISATSGVAVVSVVNHVFLFFKLARIGAGRANRGLAELRKEPGYAFPRVDSVPEV